MRHVRFKIAEKTHRNSNPGSNPGSDPASDPGSNHSSNPGSNRGSNPGSNHSSNPASDPGSNPGLNPGSDLSLSHSEARLKTIIVIQVIQVFSAIQRVDGFTCRFTFTKSNLHLTAAGKRSKRSPVCYI